MIRCYAGLQGSGKSLSMVSDARHVVRETHCDVYTNMMGLKCPQAIYFDDINELLHISHGLVLLDEAGIVIPAQFWQELGRDLLVKMCQMRKSGLDLYYTAQRFDGVNVNLRENTHTVVRLSKLGPFMLRSDCLAGEKQGARGLPRRYDPVVFDLYNTDELINKDGGSDGALEGQPISTRARKRLAAEDARRKAAAPKRRALTRWHLGSNEMSLTPAARAAEAYLVAHGWWSDVQPWADQIRRELLRRQWLAKWGLGPDDAPYYCTPESPWAEGFHPLIVKERSARRKADEAAEIAALKSFQADRAASRRKKEAV